jgi:alpha-L-fucosidase
MSNKVSAVLLATAALVTLPGVAPGAHAQYEARWESLDRRPNPEWWSDAKFGIFIHWGVYSVPAFSRVGDYSEWYWRYLADGRDEYVAFHRRVYGDGFTYADFVPHFRAELFDPAQWADTFRRSGATYVVLTSKHHDGYTLWPSAEANRSWGRPWNSVETGPRRDLAGELSEAVRGAGLRMGFYYSLYEWYNPLYRSDVPLFVEQHMLPQIKDLVTRYRPSIVWSDGEWEHPSATWRSEEFLAWLFNESPVREDVVINDRWGRETRHRHGGHYTTEYGSGLPTAQVPWEETRGMAHSFGYSRTERVEHYNTAQQLILMLVDIVSRGGNFLLDIGPSGDGRIPVIMEQRLLEMGEWLEVNGEAIYGTRAWTRAAQWSAGEIREPEPKQHMGEYDILKLTVRPDPGMAVKEVMFTRRGDTLYAITPRFPRGELRLQEVVAAAGAEVTLLGHGQPLRWSASDGGIVIRMPEVAPDELPTRHAYVFRITQVRPR